MNQRISTIVYAALTVLAVAVAATAKGYAATLGEFAFIVMVTSVGLFVAHFWSAALGKRLTGQDALNRDWLVHEAQLSASMLLPGSAMALLAALGSLVLRIEWAVTVSMGVLVALLFAYTWVGARRVGGSWLWPVGTAGIGVLMVVFKVVA